MRHLPPSDVGIFIQRIFKCVKVFKEVKGECKHEQEIKDKWKTRSSRNFDISSSVDEL